MEEPKRTTINGSGRGDAQLYLPARSLSTELSAGARACLPIQPHDAQDAAVLPVFLCFCPLQKMMKFQDFCNKDFSFD